MTIIAYTQQVLDMEALFGTSANCTEGIYPFIVKGWQQVEVGHGLLNVA